MELHSIWLSIHNKSCWRQLSLKRPLLIQLNFCRWDPNIWSVLWKLLLKCRRLDRLNEVPHTGTLTGISTGSSWQENNKLQTEVPKASCSLFFFFSFCVQVSLFFPKNAKMLAKEFAGSDSWITIHFGENYLPWQEVFNFPTVANTCSQSLNQLCV